jgi:hypothetical protein
MKRTKNYLKSITLMVIVLPVVFSMGCKDQVGEKSEWKPLFDGETLDGWKAVSGEAEFYVEDKMIVGKSELNKGAYLVTEKNYEDFVLELDAKIDTGLNSGIQCRGYIWPEDTTTMYKSGNQEGTIREMTWEAGYVTGYQIELDPSDRAWSGGLYEPGNRGWLVTLKHNEAARKSYDPLDWNHFKIRMEDDRIKTWVNGTLAVNAPDTVWTSGFIGFQLHKAYHERQDGKHIRFKNIKIKAL